jgi:nitroreductase
MPNPRLGFGQENLLKLIGECILFISSYGENDIQLKHAVAVIMEYYNFHLVNNHTLPSNVLDAIMKIQPHFAGVKSSVQKEISCDDYFAMIGNKFDTFSKSRASVRNFSDKSISIECLKSAIELSRNTPSACNRQPWRVYVYSDAKKIQAILNTQGGSRGFGNLSNKLIVIAGELGVFGHSFERNQVFVDCGMYAMNLLYSLHFHRIAACILNGNTTPSKDKILRKLCGFKDSEVLIAMIACGSPPEHFKLATSPRYEIDHFITVEH